MANTERPPVQWIRKQTPDGTEYRAKEGRVVIAKRIWKKPGFKNITSSGWVILLDGIQHGSALPTAKKAREWSELPGVYNQIARQLELHDRQRLSDAR